MDELFQLQKSNEMEYHNQRMKVVAIEEEAANFRRQTEKIRFEIAQEELAQLKKRRTENGTQIFSPLITSAVFCSFLLSSISLLPFFYSFYVISCDLYS